MTPSTVSPRCSEPPEASPGPPDAAARYGRIGCVTTSRADAGVYRPLLRALADDQQRAVACFIGGTHFADEFGATVNHLPPVNVRTVRVEHYAPGDRPADVAETAGRAVVEFGRAFDRAPCDLLFVLGDRTEMLAAALAATIHTIPIAHLHGGDVTAGAIDNQCRHALTKLAHLHFPATRDSADRIIAMGEPAWRVHAVGALALDELRAHRPESAKRLGEVVGLDFRRPTIVVSIHPETLSPMPAARQIDEVLAALGDCDADLLLIGTNADVGRAAVDAALRGLAAARAGVKFVASLPQPDYWSCLARAAALVGNSSAGIIEAASFKLPVVNVGGRQDGRLKPANVIDAPLERTAVAAAVRRALDPGFRAGLADLVNPYGDGRAAERIVAALQDLPPRDVVLRKQ